MAQVTLTATDDATHREIDANLVTDLLWGVAGPEHGLEHLHVVVRHGRIDIVVFHLATDNVMAHYLGHQLGQLAIAAAPQLRGWRITPLEDADVPT